MNSLCIQRLVLLQVCAFKPPNIICSILIDNRCNDASKGFLKSWCNSSVVFFEARLTGFRCWVIYADYWTSRLFYSNGYSKIGGGWAQWACVSGGFVPRTYTMLPKLGPGTVSLSKFADKIDYHNNVQYVSLVIEFTCTMPPYYSIQNEQKYIVKNTWKRR